MMEQDQFWMVWNPLGYQPRMKHWNEDAAVREAKRLARENPGQQFYVLEAIAGVEKIDVAVHTYRASDSEWEIPF